MFFIIISALHVLGGFSANRQELVKLYVQSWVLSCFPAVYRWCGRQQESMTIPKAAHTVLHAPDDGHKNCPKHVER